MKRSLNIEFVRAVRDFIFLLNNNYPERSVLKLVGDKYKLSGIERTMLYRGVTSEKESGFRKSKLVASIPDKNDLLHIDFCNQLYHIISYLKGNRVFISTDGVVRDASEFHGKKIHPDLIKKSIQLFSHYINSNIQNRRVIYIDNQINIFPEIINQIEDSDVIMDKKTIVHPSLFVDKELTSQTSGIVATSDSQIIDNTNLYVFDLSRSILEFHFQPVFFNLSSIVR
ncbi:MAG: DUF434 domain-containing protein [Bacteroidales bacterium]